MQIIRRGYFTNFYPLDKMFRLQRVSLMFHRFERFSLIVGFFDLLSLTRTTGSDTSAAICREIRWIIKYARSWRWISFFLVSFRCTRSWSQNFGIKKKHFSDLFFTFSYGIFAL